MEVICAVSLNCLWPLAMFHSEADLPSGSGRTYLLTTSWFFPCFIMFVMNAVWQSVIGSLAVQVLTEYCPLWASGVIAGSL